MGLMSRATTKMQTASSGLGFDTTSTPLKGHGAEYAKKVGLKNVEVRHF